MNVHAESLLYKLTNNYAESFNAIVAVEVGDKRINWGLRGQYNIRVYASVIRHNSEALLLSVYNATDGFVPQIVDTVDSARIEKNARKRILR